MLTLLLSMELSIKTLRLLAVIAKGKRTELVNGRFCQNKT